MPNTKYAPKRPSALDMIELISGPKVEICVGAEKKYYCLPINLLSYYSPYFKDCFNGQSVKAKTQTLMLPEDDIEFFETMLEWIIAGAISEERVTKDMWKMWPTLLEFLHYCDKYGVGEACVQLYIEVIEKHDKCWLIDEDVEMLFRVFAPGHRVRELAAQCALSEGIRNYIDGETTKKLSITEVSEREVDGYAAEFLKQLRKGLVSLTWFDPLRKEAVTVTYD